MTMRRSARRSKRLRRRLAPSTPSAARCERKPDDNRLVPRSDTHVVILAAGKGTRMKSAQPKVLHRVAGTRMIDRVLEAAASLQPRSTIVVVGHQGDVLRSALSENPNITFVVQEPQLGTGHALLQTETALGRAVGTLLLLSGDVPLLKAQTLQVLLARHIASGAAATVVTSIVDEPFGYGRIVRDGG